MLIRKFKSNDISQVIRYGKGYKFLAIAILTSLISTILDIKTFSLVPNLVNSLGSNNGEITSYIYFVIFAIVSGLTRVFLIWISSRINAKISTNISKRIIRNINQININSLEKLGTSSLSQIYSNDIQTLSGELLYPLLTIITSSILVISLFIYLIFKLPFPTITFGVIYLFIYLIFIRATKNKIRGNSRETATIRAKFVEAASEIVVSYRYLKTSSTGKRVTSYLEKEDRRIKNFIAENIFLSSSPKFIAESIGLILLASIAIIISTTNKENAIPSIAFFALCLQRLLPSINSIFVAISSINGNSGSLRRINKFINLSKDFQNTNEFNSILNRFNQVKPCDSIEKNDIEDTPIIDLNIINIKTADIKIKFKLFKNKWVAITGKSGAGKTSFMDVITGIVKPDKDSNKEYLEMSKKLEKIKFVYLSQFSFIPNTTILEYITNTNNRFITDKQVKFVDYLLDKSGLKEELSLGIMEIEQKTIGENAGFLSGGQAQRLNILRCIYEVKEPIKSWDTTVLALDEPFKGLDKLSKNRCAKLIKETCPTAILITHSSEEAMNLCDYIYKVK
tara:strand:+ start:1490 stop:3187 length:1698 start_codon:yes stop_codon:yes gene_type:complete